MKFKTIKKKIRKLHRTAKRYLKSGGGGRGRKRNFQGKLVKSVVPNIFSHNIFPPLNGPARGLAAPAPVAVAAPVASIGSTKKLNYSRPNFIYEKGYLPTITNETNLKNETSLQLLRDSFFDTLQIKMSTGNGNAKNVIKNAVALDCEMVGIGDFKYNRGAPYKESTLAHVVIVGFDGEILINEYVIPKEGLNAITNYRQNYSGIKPSTLIGLNPETHSFDIIKERAHNILKDKIIVGHGLDNDFKVLEYIPENPIKVWDTAKIDEYMKTTKWGQRGPERLKTLVLERLGYEIQPVGKPHNPEDDALASMNLYRHNFGFPLI